MFLRRHNFPIQILKQQFRAMKISNKQKAQRIMNF